MNILVLLALAAIFAVPVPPGVEQRNFVRSRNIAFAKRRAHG
jgi:hypothetical protein